HGSRPHPVKSMAIHHEVGLHRSSTHQIGGPGGKGRSSTTSFLTATTLVYAIGAGITAAAGTRLALQLILVKGFKLYSLQLYDPKGPLYCYLLSLPPRVGLG